MTTDFGCFTTPDHAELVEEALAETYAADSQLAAFLEGGIHILPDPFSEPDRPRPWLALSAGTDDLGSDISNEGERILDILNVGAYDEQRPMRQPGERTVKAFVNRARIAAYGDALLENTTVSSTNLVDRLDRFQVVRYDLIRFADGSTTMIVQWRIRYIFITDLATGQRTI